MEWLDNDNLSFCDPQNIFENTIRHNPDKHIIVSNYAKLDNLKSVNLRKCRLDYLPKFESKNIEFLDLSCNNFTRIPDWVFELKNLRYLSVGSNLLSELQDTDHMSLEVLKIHKNKISKLKTCSSVKFLNLYLNQFDEIPDISHLKNLEFLSFGMTNLKALPDWILTFSNLKWLSLVVNKIEYLPKNFHLLHNLKGMRIAKNSLFDLPDSIGLMTNLEELSLYSNNLSSLPNSFYELNLKKLNLSKNPLKNKNELFESFKNIDFFSID
jgi:Leucine-rich repeat (LRR) protein